MNLCRTKLLPFRKEKLAIVFACSKFIEYLFGKRFIIESDHKLLKSSLNTPMHKIPGRIQSNNPTDNNIYHVSTKIRLRSKLRLRQTPYVFWHLSRASLKEQTAEMSQTEVNCQVHSVPSSFPIRTERLTQLEVETLDDKTLQRVAIYIAEGCPKSRNQLNPELKLNYNLRDEFAAVNDLFLKGSKIATPSTLIKEMKHILHTGHLCIDRTKSNARSTMYWPNIDKDIDEMINNCDVFQKYWNLIPLEPLLSHEITKLQLICLYVLTNFLSML